MGPASMIWRAFLMSIPVLQLEFPVNTIKCRISDTHERCDALESAKMRHRDWSERDGTGRRIALGGLGSRTPNARQLTKQVLGQDLKFDPNHVYRRS